MKAFKPDGSRWYRSDADDVWEEWLHHGDLLCWLDTAFTIRYFGASRSLERRVLYGVRFNSPDSLRQQAP